MYTLLLVDDEIEILDFLADICGEITEYDLEILKAGSARAALEIVHNLRVDVVLSDIRMPGMDGVQLLEAVRHEAPKCKCILLTGYRNFDTVCLPLCAPFN